MPSRYTIAAGVLLGVAAVLAQACATAGLPPPVAVREAVLAEPSYSAELGVSFKGPRGRARATVLVALARPDSLRVEVPGPTGARLIVVARLGRLTAVFPAERALFEGPATAEGVDAVLGVKLTPSEIMDVLLGAAESHLTQPRVDWGARLPRKVSGRLSDGTRLTLRVRAADAPAALGPAAFAAPASAGYRTIDADEARNMWARR